LGLWLGKYIKLRKISFRQTKPLEVQDWVKAYTGASWLQERQDDRDKYSFNNPELTIDLEFR